MTERYTREKIKNKKTVRVNLNGNIYNKVKLKEPRVQVSEDTRTQGSKRRLRTATQNETIVAPPVAEVVPVLAPPEAAPAEARDEAREARTAPTSREVVPTEFRRKLIGTLREERPICLANSTTIFPRSAGEHGVAVDRTLSFGQEPDGLKLEAVDLELDTDVLVCAHGTPPCLGYRERTG